jgi:hypothetical protein
VLGDAFTQKLVAIIVLIGLRGTRKEHFEVSGLDTTLSAKDGAFNDLDSFCRSEGKRG